MSEKKGYAMHIPGIDLARFESIFCAYVQTGKEASSGIVSDYTGTIDTEGKFFITRRGRDTAKGQNNEAQLIGAVRADNEKKETVVEYYTRMSSVFLTCMVILGLLCAGFLTYALIAYFRMGKTGPLLPASFFTIAFLVVVVISLLRPDCRALEKTLEKIVFEYADLVDPEREAPVDEAEENTENATEGGENHA